MGAEIDAKEMAIANTEGEAMGFFSKVVGSVFSGVEKRLFDENVASLVSVGHSQAEAEQIVSGWMRGAKEEGRQAETDKLPDNFGDYLLANESKNMDIRAMLETSRADGATNQDIRQWWNMSDLERRLFGKQDDMSRMALMIDWLHKNGAGDMTGFTEERKRKAFDEAAHHVRRHFPMYGDPKNTTLTQGDDRPLTPELRFRVITYNQRRVSDPTFSADVATSSTFNALVRREIAAGRL